MLTNENNPSLAASFGCRCFSALSGSDGHGQVDSEAYEQQCALLEHNEQAAKRRAYQNEYWRQRTLARQCQMQPGEQSDAHWKTLISEDQPLEAMNPKHRVGELLNVFMDVYNKLKPSTRFFDWVSSMSPTTQLTTIQKAMEDRGYDITVRAAWVRTFNRGIRYMNAGERSSYTIQIENGLLYQNGSEFDTSRMKTQFSGPGVAIFVQSVDGTFYSSSHLGGRLQRSNDSSEPPCRSAGEWKVEKGKISWVSGKSRFYEPTMAQLADAVRDLQCQNALTADYGIDSSSPVV